MWRGCNEGYHKDTCSQCKDSSCYTGSRLQQLFFQSLIGAKEQEVCNTSLTDSTAMEALVIPVPLDRLDPLLQGINREGGRHLASYGLSTLYGPPTG